MLPPEAVTAARAVLAALRDRPDAPSLAEACRAAESLLADGTGPPVRFVGWRTQAQSDGDEEFWEQSLMWEMHLSPARLELRSYVNHASVRGARQSDETTYRSDSDTAQLSALTTQIASEAHQPDSSVSAKLGDP